ncbi:hypothetical protein FRC08_001857 [Ceratobasidium sp. 394]|nr:hypothetical protein FRC08_001857 [Ceratobasidium sp. 394]
MAPAHTIRNGGGPTMPHPRGTSFRSNSGSNIYVILLIPTITFPVKILRGTFRFSAPGNVQAYESSLAWTPSWTSTSIDNADAHRSAIGPETAFDPASGGHKICQKFVW